MFSSCASGTVRSNIFAPTIFLTCQPDIPDSANKRRICFSTGGHLSWRMFFFNLCCFHPQGCKRHRSYLLSSLFSIFSVIQQYVSNACMHRSRLYIIINLLYNIYVDFPDSTQHIRPTKDRHRGFVKHTAKTLKSLVMWLAKSTCLTCSFGLPEARSANFCQMR